MLKSEERFRELANMLPQTVFEIDVQGNLIYSNQMGIDTTGYSYEDIKKGLNASQIVVPNEREKILENLSRIIDEKIDSHNEYTILRKDGTIFSGIIYSSPIVQDNIVVGLRGLIIDITDRKKAEKE